MMATLSGMAPSSPAALEVSSQPFGGRDARGPPEQSLELRVRVSAALPVRMPRESVEDRRELARGPRGIPLPRQAEEITHGPRDRDGREPSDALLVEPQELSARREVVVDHVEDFAVDPLRETRQYDSVGAIVDVREG